MRECWSLLDQTSRSFSMVIKELDDELARVVSGGKRCDGGDGGVHSGLTLLYRKRVSTPVHPRSASFISSYALWTRSKTT
jgi:hypothetical protein